MANCKEVDDLSLQLLQLMNELMSCKVQIENSTAEGFLYMAKSRILLGKERVSKLQLPISSENGISPIYTVSRNSDSDDDLSLIDRRFQASLVIKDAEKETSVTPDNEEMKLTRRIVTNTDKTSKTLDVEDSSSCTETERTQNKLEEKVTDPLKWFGVLVPQELRMSQKAFAKAVSLAVDCANIQSKIDATINKLESAKMNIL
ncbi:hypothetical protein J437_LFUL007915 [Ladona fulva]|uniref:Vacuolar ATPase assembly protein VMA22 n=1 Tax=Ladona fulva TaxID=123851 RepID=A0A8K0K9M7_LADFU|nr:hypothetical protein J437_LFUL007915 [Ladona fulva]